MGLLKALIRLQGGGLSPVLNNHWWFWVRHYWMWGCLVAVSLYTSLFYMSGYRFTTTESDFDNFMVTAFNNCLVDELLDAPFEKILIFKLQDRKCS